MGLGDKLNPDHDVVSNILLGLIKAVRRRQTMIEMCSAETELTTQEN